MRPPFLDRLLPRPPTLIFLHIPKTGGISLREVLRARCKPAFRIMDPVDDRRWLLDHTPTARAAFRLIEGHLYYGVHELVPRPCLYLTMLRDPIDRVLSYYSYIREWERHHLYERARGMSLADCLDAGLTVEMDNFMVRCLTSFRNIHLPFGAVTRDHLIEAKAHLDGFAGIGLTERFDESLRRFCDLFGWPRVPAPRLNETKDRVGRESLIDRDLDLIRRHNALDIELHAYARELFEARGATAAG